MQPLDGTGDAETLGAVSRKTSHAVPTTAQSMVVEMPIARLFSLTFEKRREILILRRRAFLSGGSPLLRADHCIITEDGA